jgi:hypothetical protein
MTAYTSGTATDYNDLLTKLRDFLTTDATLVAANEHWVVEKEDPTVATYTMTGVAGTQTYTGSFRDIYMRAPGLSQTDNIYINFRRYQNSVTSLYNWAISGATGYEASSKWESQPNNSLVSGHFSYISLPNAAINYTIVANGRRFLMYVSFEGDTYVIYCGYILPYGLPSEYPYPLFISGTTSSIEITYSNSTVQNFYANTSSTRSALRQPNGVWRATGGSETTNITSWPWKVAGSTYWNLLGNLDGSFTLLPSRVYCEADNGNVWGEYEGLYYVTKVGAANNLAAGDTITIDAVVYLVAQNGQQLDDNEYCAIRKS